MGNDSVGDRSKNVTVVADKKEEKKLQPDDKTIAVAFAYYLYEKKKKNEFGVFESVRRTYSSRDAKGVVLPIYMFINKKTKKTFAL